MPEKLKQDRKERNLYHNDELDIRYLVNKLEDGIKYVAGGLGSMFRAVARRVVLVVLFTLLGAGIGFLFFKSAKPYYTSSMTLVLAEIRNQFVENQLQRLTIMIQEGNFDAVAKDLEISVDAAKHIKDMSFSNLDQEIIAEDSILTGSPFEIELSLYNNTLFSSLEPALANYLESNNFFSKQKMIRQREIELMISKLEKDIKAIDSIKTNVTSPQGPVNGFVYGSPIDPTELFRESISMYEQQVELEGNLKQLDNIQIVNGFAPRLRPSGPNLLKYLTIGGGVAFLLSIPIALYLESNRRRRLSRQ